MTEIKPMSKDDVVAFIRKLIIADVKYSEECAGILGYPAPPTWSTYQKWSLALWEIKKEINDLCHIQGGKNERKK